jgi:starch synthase
MPKAKILHVSQELMPYTDETEIARVSRLMPQQLQEAGYDVRLFMPCFGNINVRKHQLHEVIRLGGTNVKINGNPYPLNIRAGCIPNAKMQCYFIDNEECFKRKFQVRDAQNTFFADNHRRMIFFARGTLHTVKKQIWQPAVVHCHGWFAALAPLYLKKLLRKDPFFENIKVVVSIYDDSFAEEFSPDFAKQVLVTGLRARDVEALTQPNYVNLMKLAIANADGVIQGSTAINEELQRFVAKRRIPMLPYVELDNQGIAYATFYEDLMARI